MWYIYVIDFVAKNEVNMYVLIWRGLKMCGLIKKQKNSSRQSYVFNLIMSVEKKAVCIYLHRKYQKVISERVTVVVSVEKKFF